MSHLTDPLNYRLQYGINIITIENDTDYQAISYVFGILENELSIQVCSEHDDSELEIRAVLRLALCHFKNGFKNASSTRTLQIYNICIDQHDDERRSQ